MRPSARGSLSANFVAIPITAFAGTVGIVFWTGGEMTAFPPAYSAPAQFALVSMGGVKTAGVRDRIVVTAQTTQFRKIVFIVDESVRGDYLGLNNSQFEKHAEADTATRFYRQLWSCNIGRQLFSGGAVVLA
jgi:hypothetical protein